MITGKTYENIGAVVSEFAQLKHVDKLEFWVHIAEQMKVNHQKLKDYFHNTWSKQYMDSIHEHKKEILEMISE